MITDFTRTVTETIDYYGFELDVTGTHMPGDEAIPDEFECDSILFEGVEIFPILDIMHRKHGDKYPWATKEIEDLVMQKIS